MSAFVATFVATQVALERAALALLGRSDVRAAIGVLAERWRAGTPGLLTETYASLSRSIDEVALLVALQVVNGDPRRPQVAEISAGPHTWGGLEVPGGRWGINNPDTLYFAVPVESASTYVLRARPRGRAPVDVNVSVQTPDVWGTLDSLGQRDLAFDEDGGFSVTLGAAPADGNRLPLDEGGTVLLVRQTLGDWTTELPYDLAVERVAGPEPEAPASADDLAARLLERLAVVIDHNLNGLQPPVLGLPANVMPQPGPAGDKAGYLPAQRNTLGHFRLAPDEALVVDVATGGAGYTAVAATNVWGVTADSDAHQNSLNSRQVDVGPDGRSTVVVANTDPNVENWIDPGGLTEGIVMLRWQLLDEVASSDGPAVSARLALLADITAGALMSCPRTVNCGRLGRQTAYARRFSLR